jgi:hypothetical protein
MGSEAYERFISSMTMDFEKWHDGIGYDLEALKQVTPEERTSIVKVLRSNQITWREIEALEAIGSAEAMEGIHKAAKDERDGGTRMAALEAAHNASGKKDMDETLPAEIRKLTTIENGLTRALLLAEEYPTEKVKQALLWASWNRTEASMHCAALLAYLCGAAKEAFDWDLRPLFLRLGPNNSYFERKKAFDELCALVKMELDTTQSF